MKILLRLSSVVGIQTEGWSDLMAILQGLASGKSDVINAVRYSALEGK
jgi:hypothetical protein